MYSDKQAAREVIAKLTDEAYKLLKQAEDIADAANVYIDFGLTYGATYIPKSMRGEYDKYDNVHTTGWSASSQSC
jgi:hypothetical protein